MTVAGTVRFVVGISLVAGGSRLVVPLATKMFAAAQAADHAAAASAPGDPAAATVPPGSGMGGGPGVPGTVPQPAPLEGTADTIAAPWPEPPAETDLVGTSDLAAASDAARLGFVPADRAPPLPPEPLPPRPHEMLQASPGLGASYRSTLHVPPPPLLDAAGPPPATTWAAPVARGLAPVEVADVTVPATYRVQDGDDLGTIASRFYGHPSAAAAIWAANRESVPHPDLLPIGLDLRLPPVWAVRGHRQSAGGIEPAAFAKPGASVPDESPPAPSQGQWLPAPATATAGSSAGAAAGEATPMADRVRLAPGETLPALAQRLYGDPALAARIFAVNRDRLRSPELVVAGMELRLPQPVRAAPR